MFISIIVIIIIIIIEWSQIQCFQRIYFVLEAWCQQDLTSQEPFRGSYQYRARQFFGVQ